MTAILVCFACLRTRYSVAPKDLLIRRTPVFFYWPCFSLTSFIFFSPEERGSRRSFPPLNSGFCSELISRFDFSSFFVEAAG